MAIEAIKVLEGASFSRLIWVIVVSVSFNIALSLLLSFLSRVFLAASELEVEEE